MKEIHVDSNLSFENVFFNSDYETLLKLAKITKGKVYINRPNIDDIISFCEDRKYNINISNEIKEIYKKTFTIYINKRKDETYILTPNLQNNSELSNDTILNKLSMKITNKLKTEYIIEEVYILYILIKHLKKEKYIIEFNESLSWLEDNNRKKGSVINSFNNNVHLLPHQKKTYNEFFDNRLKNLILCDDPGLGKTITIGSILKTLYDDEKIQKILWVVPSFPLAMQISEEFKSSFDVESIIISNETIKNSNLKYDMNNSPYLRSGLVIVTWSTFRNDFEKNFDKTKYFKFDVAVFDEFHVAKYSINISNNEKYAYFKLNKSAKSMNNICCDYKFGLSGSPAPNGKWSELYGGIRSIDPLKLKSSEYYTSNYKRIYISYKNKDNNDNIIDKTNEFFNKKLIPRFSTMICRNSRKELEISLPILKSKEIITRFNEDEQKIFSKLNEIKMEMIEMKKESNKSIYKYAIMMFWQDIRKYSAYGKKILIKRLTKILQYRDMKKENTTKSQIYKFLCDFFSNQLQEILNILKENTRIRNYAKMDDLYNILSERNSSHTIVFVSDSVESSIDIAVELKKKKYDTKVVIGSDSSYEKNQFEKDYEYLNQRNPSDKTTPEIINWFWSPYKDLIMIQKNNYKDLKVQIITDFEKNNLINIMKSKVVKILIKGNINKYSSLIESIVSEIRKSDKGSIIKEDEDKIMIKFRPLLNDNKKILVCTDKLSTGINLQIAETTIFYNVPYSLEKYEQKVSRMRRMGSPHSKNYLYSIINGNEKAINNKLNNKYKNVKGMGYKKK